MSDILKISTGVVYLWGAIGPFTATGPITEGGDLNLATTSTDGLVLQNTTVTTAGVPVQIAPRLRFRSQVWNTTAVAANNTNDWWIESVPASGLVPEGLLKIVSSLNGGAPRNELTLSGGVGTAGLTTLGNITTTGGYIAGAGGFLSYNTRAAIYSPADGQINIFKSDQVTGVGFDYLTANVLKVRTSAQTGYALVDALGYRINGGAGAVDSVDKIQKSVASIANAAATTVLTITVPNAAHSATILVTNVGSLGAGGAIGANEASASNSYYITVTRTPGVNAVAAISPAFGNAAAAVVGAATVTSIITVAAVVGGVGASNTFPVQVTITKSGGASDNHTCQLTTEVLNANATGITIA